MHSVKLKAFILASAAVTRINFLLLSPAETLESHGLAQADLLQAVV